MSISSGTVSVGTAATQINGSSSNPIVIHVANNDNTDTMYLGGAAVTTSNGLALLKQERITITLSQGDRLYAVSTKEGHVLSYLQQTL
jgi:hypothetical protein